jgi:hypothetical protein
VVVDWSHSWEFYVKFIQPTPPSRRKLERVIGWIILVLTCLAVPHTHGALQYCGLLLVGLLLIALNHVIIAATAKVPSAETPSIEGKL